MRQGREFVLHGVFPVELPGQACVPFFGNLRRGGGTQAIDFLIQVETKEVSEIAREVFRADHTGDLPGGDPENPKRCARPDRCLPANPRRRVRGPDDRKKLRAVFRLRFGSIPDWRAGFAVRSTNNCRWASLPGSARVERFSPKTSPWQSACGCEFSNNLRRVLPVRPAARMKNLVWPRWDMAFVLDNIVNASLPDSSPDTPART